MNLKRLCSVLVNIALVSGIILQSGCSAAHVSSVQRKSHKITIGFSMDTLKEERWYKDRTGFEKEAKRLNANVITEIAYENSTDQFNQVKDMVSRGINLLVIIPHDAKIAADAVNYAKKYGVKVISYDRLVLNANVDLYISFDNEKVGELQANSIVKAIGKGNLAIVRGPSSDHNTILIDEGIKKALSPYIKSGKIHIVKQVEASDWMADEAYSCISGLLRKSVRLNGVIAENDGLAGGVIDALSERHLVPKVPVVGMDADLSACQRVVEGQQLMTVYKPIDKLAVAAADIAVKMAGGHSIKIGSRISDGKYKVPYYKIEPVAVYKSNMNRTVIKDRFHSLHDVYLNVPKANWPVVQ